MNLSKSIMFVLALVMVFSTASFAAVVYVNGSSNGCTPSGLVTTQNFSSIQLALNNLSGSPSSKLAPNVIIVCKNGTAAHTENVLVNSTSKLPNYHVVNVTITGNESGVLIKPFDTTLPIFNISASNVVISNFTLEGSVSGYGGLILAGNASLWQVENVTIQNNTFRNSGVAITVVANNTFILFNSFQSNVSQGIAFGGVGGSAAPQDALVRENNFTGNASYFVSGSGGSVASSAIYVGQDVLRVNITGNNISNYTFGVYTHGGVASVTNTRLMGVTLGTAIPNRIYNNTFGVWLNNTRAVFVMDNTIENNTYNVVSTNATSVNISENTIMNGVTGIFVSAFYNNLSYNNITNASQSGVHVNGVSLATAGDLMNVSISGGWIAVPSSTASRGITIGGTGNGNPLGAAAVTAGLNISLIGIDGVGAPLLSTMGIDFNLNNRDVNVSNVSISKVGMGIHAANSIDSGGAYALLSYVLLFNNTYGMFFNESASASTFVRMNFTNSRIFNNSEAGIFMQSRANMLNSYFRLNQFYENKYGIRLNASANMNFTNNNFENNSLNSSTAGYAIYLLNSNATDISNNSFYVSSTNHIYLQGSILNSLFDNNFTNVSDSSVDSILFHSSSNNNTLRGGFMEMNSSVVRGIQVNGSNNNNVSNTRVIYILNTTAPASVGIFVTGATGFVADNVNVSRFSTGIVANSSTSSSTGVRIMNSRIFNNTNRGVWLASVTTVSVNGSTFHNNTNEHLNLTDSSGGSVFSNLFNRSFVGIAVRGTTDVIFRENNLTYNNGTSSNFGQVVVVAGTDVSSGNNFSENNISHSSHAGFYLESGSSTSPNLIIKGNVYNNTFGIILKADSGRRGVTVNGVALFNLSASAFALNGSTSGQSSGVPFNFTNNLIYNCNTGAHTLGCIFINTSSNVGNLSGNNISNVSGTAIHLYMTNLSVFENNNITNATTFAYLINNSNMTFSGHNSIHLNESRSQEVEIYLERGSINTFSNGRSWNITTTRMLFALNSTINLSLKVVNVSQNINVNISRINGETPTNGSILKTLTDNAGNRNFEFGLNVTNTSGFGPFLRLIVYYNTTNYTNLGGTGAFLMGTTGQNWSLIQTGTLDTTLGYMYSGESMHIPYGYVIPAAFVMAGTTAAATSSTTDAQKTQPSISYKYLCPEDALEVTSESDVTFKLYQTSPSFKLVETKSADSSGKASFTITQAGNYEVDASGSNYVTNTLGVKIELCKAGEAGVVKEGEAVPESEVTETPGTTPEETPEVPVVEVTQQQVLDAISAADSAINTASKEGKDVTEAKAKLDEAGKLLSQGEYKEALKAALEAQSLAKAAKPKSTAPSTTTKPTAKPSETPKPAPSGGFDFGTILLVLVVIVVIGVGVYYFTKGGKGKGYAKGFKGAAKV